MFAEEAGQCQLTVALGFAGGGSSKFPDLCGHQALRIREPSPGALIADQSQSRMQRTVFRATHGLPRGPSELERMNSREAEGPASAGEDNA